MTLLDKLLKASVTDASLLSQSKSFQEPDFIKTEIPILNLAFSGDVEKGFYHGLTIFAGESKTYKTALALFCMKAYLEKYKDAVAVFYDTEGGINEKYIQTFNIDTNRVIYIPVEHVEQLKFDIIKKLSEIEKNEKVFFLIDSIGQIASKKETDDAIDEKSVADMSRAKAIRSLLRMIVIQLNKKMLPCFMINHVYQEMGMFPKTVIPGGTSVVYSANTIFVITKSQEKANDGELLGWNFTLNVYKSRMVKEKSKFTINVNYEKGINKWSGLFDVALDLGFIVKTKVGWYSIVDKETGEISDKNYRAADLISNSKVWENLLQNKTFLKELQKTYGLGNAYCNDFTDEKEEE